MVDRLQNASDTQQLSGQSHIAAYRFCRRHDGVGSSSKPSLSKEAHERIRGSGGGGGGGGAGGVLTSVFSVNVSWFAIVAPATGW